MINNKFNVFYVNYIMTDDRNNTILQFIKFVLLLHANIYGTKISYAFINISISYLRK